MTAVRPVVAILLAAILLLVLAVPAPSQPATPEAPDNRPADNGRRDPTVPGRAFQQLMADPGNLAGDDEDALPDLPAVRLLARLIAPGRPPVVLLGVGGTTHTVRPGDSFTVVIAGERLELTAEAVTADEVRLQVDPHKLQIIVR